MATLLQINPEDHRPEPCSTPETAIPMADVTGNARSSPGFAGHEAVFEARNPAIGFHALIAIHDRTLGPAVGGCRIWRYANRSEALTDVLRLSHGMTLKASIAGVAMGGGKAVILAGPDFKKTPQLFHALGGALNALQGCFYTGQDVGVSKADIDLIAEVSNYVLTAAGDPSPMTAFGVKTGIAVAARHRLGRRKLTGIRIAVQGLGKVGHALCELLHAEGARLVVADIDAAAVRRAVAEFGAEAADSADIHRAAVDVFAPCALGGGLNEATIPALECAIVAGAANNQLLTPQDGEALRRRKILHAPDFVINAGGLIAAASGFEAGHYDAVAVRARTARIGDTLAHIFKRSENEGVATDRVAAAIAQERIAGAKGKTA